MNTNPIIKDTEKYRDKISTIDEQGKRVWIYPKKPKGRFYNARTYVSYGLLAILFGLPFIKWNGEPLVLLNVLDRNFILFGLHFTPQDFHLFVFAMLTFIVFIVLFTVIFGRLFCGWVCPQTIFMEMVFRKIEYWIEGDANAQKRLNKAPWTTDKLIKKGTKQFIFIAISHSILCLFPCFLCRGWFGTNECCPDCGFVSNPSAGYCPCSEISRNAATNSDTDSIAKSSIGPCPYTGSGTLIFYILVP